MRSHFIIFASLGMAALTAGQAFAQERTGLSFEAGAGVQSAPGYFGAPDNSVGATGSFALDRLRFGPFDIGGGPDTDGIGFTGSFRFIGERSAEEYAELAGLDTIDPAIELGGGLSWTSDAAEAYAVLRRGFGGHEGYVAEIGGDIIVPVNNSLTLRGGPRLLAGDDAFAGTYFGVTAAEAAASPFDAYTPEGGVLSRGVEMSARYEVSQGWALTGTVTYTEWLNDAAQSPIVRQGSESGVSASLIVSRDISFGF